MKEPSVATASCQNAAAAKASPSIGSNMVLTGTPFGSRFTAASKCARCFSADTLLAKGFFSPRVGRPSVISRILSGRGLKSAASSNAWYRLVLFSCRRT